MECSIINPALSLLMKRLVIGQRQKAPICSAFHWSPHGSLVSIGQHFITTRVVHLPKRTETSVITESGQSGPNHQLWQLCMTRTAWSDLTRLCWLCFVTTVNILLQICDDCVTAARQQNWTYHFLKNLHLLERETYLNKTQYNYCFCKCCSHPYGRIHAHTKEPMYSEFAIVAGCPSQLDVCTKTLPFILLLGQFKQMNLLANRHV